MRLIESNRMNDVNNYNIIMFLLLKISLLISICFSFNIMIL